MNFNFISMNFKWVSFPEKGYEIATGVNDCEAYYYPKDKWLILKENGKYFDDHAVAKFGNVTQKEAEFILSKIKTLMTA